MVPFANLDPTYPTIATTVVPASPDPAQATELPACRADDLRLSPSREGVGGGTIALFVEIRAEQGVECRLEGYPDITFLDNGSPVDIPTQRGGASGDYRAPVRVTPDDVALLSLWWGSGWCTTPVHNDTIRAALPEAGGTVEFEGFGGSPNCNGEPGSGPNPVTVWSFAPQDPRPAETRSAFYDVEVSEHDLSTPKGGAPFEFAVTLTTKRTDISLNVCPDFTIAQSKTADTWDETRYALNCEAVPGRVLPKGVPVTFRMDTVLYLPRGKHIWRLEVPDPTGVSFGYGS